MYDPVQWAMADPGHADRSVDVKHDCRLAFGSGHGKHENTLLKTHEKTLEVNYNNIFILIFVYCTYSK